MKSSFGRFRRLMIILFIVLMAACLGFSMFFMACNGDNNPDTGTDDEGAEDEGTADESGGSSSSEDVEYEWVTTSFDYTVAYAVNGGTAVTDGYKQGIYTIEAGSGYFEAEDFNTQGADIDIVLSGTTNEISFRFVSATGSGTYIKLLKDGVDVTPSTWPEGEITSNDSVKDFILSATDLGPGTYTISTNRAARIYNLSARQYLAVSDPVGISATVGTADFLMGTTINVNDLGLDIILNYENGRQDPLTSSQVTTDLASLELTVGMHEVTISYNYTKGDVSDTFSTTVEIYIYSIDSIVISDFSMEKSGSNYITHNVQKVFLVGDEVNYDYAAVTATAVCTYKDENGKDVTLYNDFILDASDVTFSTDANTNTAGSYTVTATANIAKTEGDAKTNTYTINVVEVTSATDITTVRVVAPSEEEGAEQATYAAGEDGVITVATVNDAVQLVKLMGATDAERKYIYVGEGQYWEKVYIDIPNLSIIGSNPTTSTGGTEGDLLGTRSEVTEIVYWAFNGMMDPSGTTNYSTVGSATFTVADSATGFYAENITFRNYWNTNALYNESRTYTSDTQADAAYINADKVHFYNVTFTGYHDTLEAENGRQYYENCYIEGRTDYIFGNTATCYFYQCNIHTIGGGSSTNGGYVTAVKGGSMTYGYVFDGCNFTSDLKSYYIDKKDNKSVPYEGFAYTEEGTVSLGRTWSSSDMHVAVINSTLDAGYSKTAYGTSGKNPRYASMSGYAPNPDYLVEYGNTGDGAISETLSGTCSVLTAEQAVNYTIENIFSSTNGDLYTDNWNPSTETTITVTVKNGSDTVAIIKATDSIDVSDLEAAVNARLSDSQVEGLYSDNNCSTPLDSAISTDTTIYVKTKERDMSVTETTFWDFTTGAYGDNVSTSKYLDADQKLYLDCGTAGSLVKENTYYYLANDATLKVILHAGSVLGIGVYSMGGLTITDETGNDLTSQGSYSGTTCTKNNFPYSFTATQDTTIIISQSATATGTLYLLYVNVMVPITETTTFSFQNGPASVSYEKCCGWFEYVYVDGTSGKFAMRYTDNNHDVQVNPGTKIYIQSVAGATVSVTTSSGTLDSTYISVGNTGLITINYNPETGNIYIYNITVTVPTT